MSEPDRQGAIGQDDLFDRWLAYHADQVSADEQQLAAELTAGEEEQLVPSIHRPTSDMERQVPGFEPIVMPSVARRRELAANPPKRGLLRGRARGAAAEKTAASSTGSRVTTQLPPPPPVGRRLTRSISGEEPDWLKSLRDAANNRDRTDADPSAAEVTEVTETAEFGEVSEVTTADLAETPTSAETAPVDHERADASADDAVADDESAVSPAEAAGMGWLDIIRDPTPHVAVDVEPRTPEVRVHRVAQARRPEAPEPVETDQVAEPVAEPVTEPEPTPEPTWADRLRAGTVTSPTPADRRDEPTDADADAEADEPTPAEPAPDWKARLRAMPDPVDEAQDQDQAEDVAPDPEPEPEPVAVRTLQVAQARRPEPEPAAPEPAPATVRTLQVAQARRPEPTPEPTPAPAAAPAAVDATPEPEPAQPAARTSTSPIEKMPEVHRFRPRRTLRTVVTLLFLIGVVLTVSLARDVYADPTQSAVAMAAVAGFVTAVVWALRATTTVTRLTVRGGQLEVARGSGQFSIDLTTSDTPLELVGTPGQRGWKALYLRKGQPPFEITSRMVDPVEFTRIVRHHRQAAATTSA